MTISDKNRARFEGIGVDLIQRDLASGGKAYIGRRRTDRCEAEEWANQLDTVNREQATIVGSIKAVGIMIGLIATLASVVAFLR